MPTAELQDLSLHFKFSGRSTGPVVVLVHSLGANLHMWDKVLPHLERNFRVLRYDARGHGLSSAPEPPYSIKQLGEDLLNLLDEHSIDRVNLCGLSLGGLVGLWLGIHASERISKLVLANTAACIGTCEGWESRIAAVQALGMAPLAEATLGRWFTSRYRLAHPDEMLQIRKMVDQTLPQGYIGCCGALRDADLGEDLVAIRTPCLVIAGSEDPVTSPQDGRALHARLHNSNYLELHASHLSAWEKSAEFASAAHDFFQGKERGNG
jgi:3-oxoadipate enol-lactonase